MPFHLMFSSLVLVLVFLAVSQGSYQDARNQEKEYCHMVKLYDQTNGKKGWPPYNGNGICD